MFQSRVKLKSTQDRTRQCPLQVDTFPEYCEELAPQDVTNETKEEETESGIDAWEAWAHYEDAKEEDDDDDDEHGGDGEAPDAATGGGDATDADAAAADLTDAAAADPADEHADGADPADEHADGAGPADAHAGAHTAPWRWNGPVRRWKHGKGNGKGQKGKQKGKQKGNQKGNHGKGNHGKGNQKGRGGKGRGGRGRNQKGTGKGASHAGGDHGGASSSTLALMSSCIVFQVAQPTHVNLKRVAIVIVPSVCAHWLSYISGSGHGAVAHAPKPWWAYRGEKRSSKAHPIGQEDQWGGRYVEGGYEIGGQVYPLLGSSYL